MTAIRVQTTMSTSMVLMTVSIFVILFGLAFLFSLMLPHASALAYHLAEGASLALTSRSLSATNFSSRCTASVLSDTSRQRAAGPSTPLHLREKIPVDSRHARYWTVLNGFVICLSLSRHQSRYSGMVHSHPARHAIVPHCNASSPSDRQC